MSQQNTDSWKENILIKILQNTNKKELEENSITRKPSLITYQIVITSGRNQEKNIILFVNESWSS